MTTDAAPAAPQREAFDLAALDILGPSNEGRKLEIVHPSGQPYRTSTGETVHVLLAGRHSDAARALLKQLGDEIAASRARGEEPSEEVNREHDTRYLVAVTKDWNIEKLDGQPFLVNPANVRKLWTDPRFGYLRGRALAFVAADTAFLAPPI